MTGQQTIRNAWANILVAASLAVVGCQDSNSLNTEITQLEGQVAADSRGVAIAKQKLWRAEAILEVVQYENELLESPGNLLSGKMTTSDLTKDSDAQQFALRELAGAWDARGQALITLVEEVRELEAGASDLSVSSRALIDRHPNRLHKAETTHRTRVEDAKQQHASPVWATARAMFSRDFLLIWIALLPALLLVWAIVRLDLRHGIRAWRRAIVNEIWLGLVSTSRALPRLVWAHKLHVAAVLALFVIVVSLWSLRPSETDLLVEYRDQLKEQLDSLENERQQFQTQAETTKQRVVTAKKKRAEQLPKYVPALINEVVGPAKEGAKVAQEKRRADLSKSHGSAREQVGKFAESVGLAKRVGAELSLNVSKAADQDAELTSFASHARSHQQNLVFIGGVLVLLFLSLNVGLVVMWRKKRSNLDRATSEVCPRCLGEDTLKTVTPEAAESSGQSRTVVQCTDKTCNYRLDPDLRYVSRLRIPTVGYTKSGKTVWLTMFHHSVERGQADKKLAKFDRAPSSGLEDVEDYDGILRRLVKDRDAPGATIIRLREPLLFNFADGDPGFVSNSILNLFDLAGEVSAPGHRGSVEQDRAYRMTDGFLYFLDPTRTDEATLSMQREQLLSFCDELRRKRNIPYGKPLNVPIAVCISKLDLLAKPGEAGGGIHQDFIDKLDPTSRDVEPNVVEIRRRHELFVSYREQFFPGWDIADQFAKLVGGRFMFFPMSAAGFTSVTGHDPKQWNFRPFGIVEPLVWLLHMNGYKTL